MRYYFITSLFLMFSFAGYAQFEFNKDRKFKPFYFETRKKLEIEEPNLDSVRFEMRFWIVNYNNEPQLLYLFNYYRNETWSILQYEFCSWDWISFQKFKKQKLTVSDKWTQKWEKLLQNDILNLPKESSVKKKWASSDGTHVLVGDGVSYGIELITKKSRRKYSYSNPEVLLKHYDLNHEGLDRFISILSILNEELKFEIKDKVQCP